MKITAKVNYGAIGTWLEPYIGFTFDVKKVGKTVIWFYMDNGKPKPDVEKTKLSRFTVNTPKG